MLDNPPCRNPEHPLWIVLMWCLALSCSGFCFLLISVCHTFFGHLQVHPSYLFLWGVRALKFSTLCWAFYPPVVANIKLCWFFCCKIARLCFFVFLYVYMYVAQTHRSWINICVVFCLWTLQGAFSPDTQPCVSMHKTIASVATPRRLCQHSVFG